MYMNQDWLRPVSGTAQKGYILPTVEKNQRLWLLKYINNTNKYVHK
jgi:hypothetical protein